MQPIQSVTRKPADLPVEQLARASSVPEQEKIGQLSKQFEAVLLRQILNDAQKPIAGGGLIKSNSANSIYQDLATAQLAEKISSSGSFGFSQSLEKQLTRQVSHRSKPEPAVHSD